MKAPSVPPLGRVAAAVNTSPRLLGVLAEAGRLEAPLLLIHAGIPDAQKEAAFRAALLKAGLSRARAKHGPAGRTRKETDRRLVDFAPFCAGCRFMKTNTLEKLRDAL